MQKLKQQTTDRNCGAVSLAMAADITVKEANALLRHPGRSHGTRADCMVAAIRRSGRACGDPVLIRKGKKVTIPPRALLMILWDDGGGHWVAYHDGLCACPSLGGYYVADWPYQRAGHYRLLIELKW